MQLTERMNIDGITINIISNNTTGTETETVSEPVPQLQANVVLGSKELTIGDFLLQDGSTAKIIFRQLLNGNRAMVATGVEFGGTWYGDRPDDGQFKDVFTDKTMELVGDTVREYVAPSAPVEWHSAPHKLILTKNSFEMLNTNNEMRDDIKLVINGTEYEATGSKRNGETDSYGNYYTHTYTYNYEGELPESVTLLIKQIREDIQEEETSKEFTLTSEEGKLQANVEAETPFTVY